MKNIKVKKNGRGGIILSVSLDGKEASYFGALLNYAPIRVGEYLGEDATNENKAINSITSAFAKNGVDISVKDIYEANKKYLSL